MRNRDYLTFVLIVIGAYISFRHANGWWLLFGIVGTTGLIHILFFERVIWPKYARDPARYRYLWDLMMAHVAVTVLTGAAALFIFSTSLS